MPNYEDFLLHLNAPDVYDANAIFVIFRVTNINIIYFSRSLKKYTSLMSPNIALTKEYIISKNISMCKYPRGISHCDQL